MMKSSLFILVLLIAVMLCPSPASAQNWTPLPTENTPQLLLFGDTPILPAQYLTNWFEGLLSGTSRGQVTLNVQGHTLVMSMNSTRAMLDGRTITLSAPMISIAGVTYLPVDSVLKALGGRYSLNRQRTMLTLVQPTTGGVARLPIRGAVLTTKADFNHDRQIETAYGAYLFFNSSSNVWGNGTSVSNPNLPLVWVTRGTKTMWSQSYPEENELAQLSQSDINHDDIPELWFTTRFIGADYVGTYFRTFGWQRGGFNNLIENEQGYLLYLSSGGLIVWESRQPSQLVLFNALYGDVHAQGPVGWAMIVYTWNGRDFVVTRTQRSTGSRYLNDPVRILETQFNIPVSNSAEKAIGQGMVAIQ